jgi:hypothetical protein
MGGTYFGMVRASGRQWHGKDIKRAGEDSMFCNIFVGT